MTLYEKARQFSIDNQPQILLERMRARLAGQAAADTLLSGQSLTGWGLYFCGHFKGGAEATLVAALAVANGLYIA